MTLNIRSVSWMVAWLSSVAITSVGINYVWFSFKSPAPSNLSHEKNKPTPQVKLTAKAAKKKQEPQVQDIKIKNQQETTDLTSESAYPSVELQEGVQYAVLDNPLVGRPKNEVINFFWYDSQQSLAVESIITQWVGYNNVKVSINNIPATLNENMVFESQLFYGMTELGFEQSAHLEYMNARANGLIDSEETLDAFMLKFGYTAKQVFEAGVSSANGSLAQDNKNIEEAIKSPEVPCIIVAGKYKVLLNNLTSVEELPSILNALLLIADD